MRKAGYSSAVHEVVDRLFVYGTLLSGETARSLVADHVAHTAPARTPGLLIGFPDYPGMLEEPGIVLGEVVTLVDLAAAFALLDAYEGDDFIRILKKIEVLDAAAPREEWAWCYVLADPRLASAGTPIPDGDWVRWRAARDRG